MHVGGDRRASAAGKDAWCMETCTVCVFLDVTNIHGATAKHRAPCGTLNRNVCLFPGQLSPQTTKLLSHSLEAAGPTSRCWWVACFRGREAESAPCSSAGLLCSRDRWCLLACRGITPTSALVLMTHILCVFLCGQISPFDKHTVILA